MCRVDNHACASNPHNDNRPSGAFAGAFAGACVWVQVRSLGGHEQSTPLFGQATAGATEVGRDHTVGRMCFSPYVA